MITIIDYGVGNINAFLNVYKKLAIPARRATSILDLEDSTRLILPGVGSFDHAMKKFNNSGMREKVEELVFQNKLPLLGICVGMQMLANGSTEGQLPGLGWIEGEVKRFDAGTISFSTKYPHMGWNNIYPVKENPLFSGLETDAEFYFLHSYYFETNNHNDVLAVTDYGIKFAASVNYENIFGIQCHPEKSHSWGIQLLKNFATF
jgi:glutamine amidotransferase